MLRLPNFAYKVPFARRDTRWSVINVHIPLMSILGGSDVQYRQQFTAIWTNFLTRNQSEQQDRPVQLVTWGSVLISCSPRIQTYNNVRLTEATRIDTSSFDMLNNGNLLFIWTMRGVVGPHGGKMKNWRFCCHGNFGDKNHRFQLPAEQWGLR